MNQKGFANIVIVLATVILVGVAGYFVLSQRITPSPMPIPTPTSPTPTPTTPTTPPTTTNRSPQQLFTSLGITYPAQVGTMARAIVVAEVLDVQVRREVNIYTFVDFQTLEVVKGDVPPRFTYRMLGGRLGNIEVNNPHYPIPTFTPGEEVVLFLGQQFSSDGYPTLFQESVYHIEDIKIYRQSE
ncbi:MAG: hypothetical protein AAB338_01645 [Patescibacteria group bacterium]